MPSIEQLEKLLAAEPDDPFVLYGLANEYAKARRTDLAVEFFDRCLAADPAYCYAYYHKARALDAAGRHEQALAAINAGLAAAKQAGDGHAASELQSLADELG
jgi:tetratricopeptide (TPR) repeat protein